MLPVFVAELAAWLEPVPDVMLDARLEARLDATLEVARLELAGALLPSGPPLGLVPAKYKSGAGGIAIPSPRKKLVCGGWL